MMKPQIHDMKDINAIWIKQKPTNKIVDCLILNENEYERIKNQLNKPFREDHTLKIKLSKNITLLINSNTKIIVGR